MPDEMPVSEMGGLAMYIDADFVAKFEVKVLKKKENQQEAWDSSSGGDFFLGELVHLLMKQFPVATEPKKAPSETHLLQRLLIYQTFPLCSRKNRLWRVLDFRGHLEKIQVGTMDQEMFEPKLRWNVCF